MLEHLVVLITGSNGRIGKACANTVLSCGGKVILLDNQIDKNINLNHFDQENFLSFNIDFTNLEELDKVIIKSIKKFGVINAAIHAAYPRSLSWGTPFENLDKNNLFLDLNMQLGGAIMFSQKIIKTFLKMNGGNLLHIGSIQGVSSPKFSHYEGTLMTSPIEYSAIKSGIIAITKYLASYYKGKNIRVNCISPGGILDKQPQIFVEKYRMSCNEKGLLNSEDLVGLLKFLLSNESRFITGQNIIIDDGWSL